MICINMQGRREKKNYSSDDVSFFSLDNQRRLVFFNRFQSSSLILP